MRIAPTAPTRKFQTEIDGFVCLLGESSEQLRQRRQSLAGSALLQVLLLSLLLWAGLRLPPRRLHWEVSTTRSLPLWLGPAPSLSPPPAPPPSRPKRPQPTARRPMPSTPQRLAAQPAPPAAAAPERILPQAVAPAAPVEAALHAPRTQVRPPQPSAGPRPQVQVGIFGNAHPGAVAPAPGATTHVGVFAAGAPGATGGAGRGPGLRVGGFAAATSTATVPTATALAARLGSFPVPQAAPAAASKQPPAPHVQSPLILFRPKPLYTPLAKQMGLQGDVVLRARLAANGHVQLLGILRHLGGGLDRQAELAAQAIRFLPAERDGHPVDWVVMLHVRFRLAD